MDQLSYEWETNEMNFKEATCKIKEIDKYVFKIQKNHFLKYASKKLYNQDRSNMKTKIINQPKLSKKNKNKCALLFNGEKNDNFEDAANSVNTSKIPINQSQSYENKIFNKYNSLYKKPILNKIKCSVSHTKKVSREFAENNSDQILNAISILELKNEKNISQNQGQKPSKRVQNSEQLLNLKCPKIIQKEKSIHCAISLPNLQSFLKAQSAQKMQNQQNFYESNYSPKFQKIKNINLLGDKNANLKNKKKSKVIIKNELSIQKGSRNIMNFKHTRKIEKLLIPIGDEFDQNDFNFNSSSEKNEGLFIPLESNDNGNYKTNSHTSKQKSIEIEEELLFKENEYSTNSNNKNKNISNKDTERTKKIKMYSNFSKPFPGDTNNNLNLSKAGLRNNAHLKSCNSPSKKEVLIKLNRFDHAGQDQRNVIFHKFHNFTLNKQLTGKKIAVSLLNMKSNGNYYDMIIPSKASDFKFSPIFYTPFKFQSSLDANLKKALAKLSQIRSISNRTSFHGYESEDHSKTTISNYSIKNSFSLNQNDMVEIMKKTKQINI